MYMSAVYKFQEQPLSFIYLIFYETKLPYMQSWCSVHVPHFSLTASVASHWQIQ